MKKIKMKCKNIIPIILQPFVGAKKDEING
jgi:hypothetical protein